MQAGTAPSAVAEHDRVVGDMTEYTLIDCTSVYNIVASGCNNGARDRAASRGSAERMLPECHMRRAIKEYQIPVDEGSAPDCLPYLPTAPRLRTGRYECFRA